ncbi:MAG TPA: histidine phosphatase family protein [Dehalococcoidia bacterium]|nr:histidine phosphatase family protein [Dehalococcoidia bacterium]
MLTLYLIRHGQTDCSKENRFCGSVDVPLNAHGKAMAEALADAFAGEAWEAVYASPLLRARQTAEPLARRLGMTVQIEPGLREIAYGAWDGHLEAEIEQLHPREFAAWANDPGRVAPPGGETAPQIADRALAALHEIRARHPNGRVLAVAHKATIRILVCALLGIDVGLFRKRIAQEVGAATVFEFKDTGPLLKALNDLSHLPPELRHVEGT